MKLKHYMTNSKIFNKQHLHQIFNDYHFSTSNATVTISNTKEQEHKPWYKRWWYGFLCVFNKKYCDYNNNNKRLL